MTDRALVVENEPDVASLFVHHLGRMGFDCTATDSAEGALDLLDHEDFDLAVVDILLPGMTGSELIDRVRSGSRHPDLAIVASSILDLQDLPGIGADATLGKPFRAQSVAQAVAKAQRAVQARTAGRKDRNV
ncbi:CheY-like chemotaxis protein [Friedmanniella endophytica]|uniref:CheY-like chemotaxis protein n=1 Tax=Microlunatus kandeliicorticis TaxID=1759536 RepID=A0A7W3IRF5_9ACTN|nr:response regulator [Microlunatus kandeliicorticis]MBA8793886.1 CheY-like chemotaxis protein [Microlunatus kandeliicorticis]